MKKCSTCHENKEDECFSKRGSSLNGQCKSCRKKVSDLWKKNNPERVLEKTARYRQRNREKVNSYSREKYAKDPEKHRKYSREYYQKNKESCRLTNKSWQQNNKHKLKSGWAKHRAKIKNAQPSWSSESVIEDFYWWAGEITRVCGENHQVDHIIPLQSDKVCGLHCEQNLQIIPRTQNQSKGNRWWPGMDGFEEYCSNDH